MGKGEPHTHVSAAPFLWSILPGRSGWEYKFTRIGGQQPVLESKLQEGRKLVSCSHLYLIFGRSSMIFFPSIFFP